MLKINAAPSLTEFMTSHVANYTSYLHCFLSWRYFTVVNTCDIKLKTAVKKQQWHEAIETNG